MCNHSCLEDLVYRKAFEIFFGKAITTDLLQAKKISSIKWSTHQDHPWIISSIELQKLRAFSSTVETVTGSLPLQRWSDKSFENSRKGVEEPHQSIPNLVVKLYCNDDTVAEVLQKVARR
ncbi:hypothetical protein Sango_2965100 [Sesamum angolense]|uniref:Uncharacterized protein n=1 Tax=Sesamum angolense TaxID=2727404 RepID=A0AAE1T4L9_9LAMI|nr:hypothetical protein Sango_2965100 [Sesamum angolense]